MKYDKIKRILIVVITITYMAIGFTYQYRYDDETVRQRISKKSTYQEHIRKRKMIYLLLLNLLKISEVTDINN